MAVLGLAICHKLCRHALPWLSTSAVFLRWICTACGEVADKWGPPLEFCLNRDSTDFHEDYEMEVSLALTTQTGQPVRNIKDQKAIPSMQSSPELLQIHFQDCLKALAAPSVC